MATAQGGEKPMTSEERREKRQQELIRDKSAKVKKSAFFMKRAMDEGEIDKAIKYAFQVCNELRTSKLNPQYYYDLYIQVVGELQHLEMTLDGHHKEIGRKDGDEACRASLAKMYERVQYTGAIIPRLYLLCCVGGLCIKYKSANSSDILFDMVELIKGVQHPTRGLFLRNYLSQVSKDKILSPQFDGDMHDVMEFIIRNFAEMNMLWVRMQHRGAVRDQPKREQQRQNLRMLVGANLDRLSRLESLSAESYQQYVLPRIIEQVIKCKDTIAQQYILDIVTNVFPAEFHILTLETYLGCLPKLTDKVSIKNILVSMMDRLASFVLERDEDSAPIPDVEMFPLFHKYAAETIQGNESMSLKDILAIQAALANFASKVYPDRLSYIDNILQFSAECLSKEEDKFAPDEVVSQVSGLLTKPLQSLLLRVLELPHYPEVLKYLKTPSRRLVAAAILEALVDAPTTQQLDNAEQVDKLLSLVDVLINNKVVVAPEDYDYDFDHELHSLARALCLIRSDNPVAHSSALAKAYEHLKLGGAQRAKYTYPGLIAQALGLVPKLLAFERENPGGQNTTKKMFKFVHGVISSIQEELPSISLRLFLQAGLAADGAKYENIAYEFFTQAFLVYEEAITQSQAQLDAVSLIAGTIQATRNFDEENYETLATKVTKHSSQLLKKPQQCRGVYSCAHLFWQENEEVDEDELPAGWVETVDDEEKVLYQNTATGETSYERPIQEQSGDNAYQNPTTVLQCLQRAVRISNLIMDSKDKCTIFIEILNKYLYFFEKGCESIKAEFLSVLISLIDEGLIELKEEDSEAAVEVAALFNRTTTHIQSKKSDDDLGERFSEIEIS